MGAFYGSIHFRTADRAAVNTVLERLAAKGNRFFLAPPTNGWVTAYPHNNGQNPKVAKTAAKRFPGVVVYTVVHDSDIFAYDVYRDGALIDQYNSSPDYFEPVSKKTRAKTAGNAAALTDLLAPGRTVDELAALLARSRDRDAGFVFADHQQAEFADLLGLPNVSLAYEYLDGGEGEDEIADWSQYVHVPDRSAELAARADEAAAVTAERVRLKRAGVLLYDEAGTETGAFHASPVFTPDATDGYLLAWSMHGSTDVPTPLLRVGPPTWQAEPTGIEVAATAYSLAVSRSGRLVAVGHAAGNWSAEVWDRETGTRLGVIPHTRAVLWVGFTPDESAVVSVGPEIVVTTVAGDRIAAVTPDQHTQLVAMHPSGTLVVVDNMGGITLYDLPTLRPAARLLTGGSIGISPLAALPPLSDADLAELRRQVERGVDEMLRRFANTSGVTLSNRDEMIERTMAGVGGSASPARSQPPSARFRPKSVAISPDGTTLACDTGPTVSLFRWANLRAATGTTPPPAVEVRLPERRLNEHMLDELRVLTLDPAGRLLMGTMSGAIFRWSPDTSRLDELTPLPGGPMPFRLECAADGASFAVVSIVMPRNRPRAHPPAFQIWRLG